MQGSPFDVFFRLNFRVTLKDDALVEDEPSQDKAIQKRVVIGLFLACDHQTNLLLDNSEEYIERHTNGKSEVLRKRHLGLLSVPGREIEKIEVEKEKYHRALMWA